jgi:hypothetical protein
MTPAARVEAIRAVVLDALERHREELGRATRSVAVIVTLAERTGRPVRVLVRTESEARLPRVDGSTT